MLYQPSHIKRHRATKDEMEERALFLIKYAGEHGPITVRGLYYQAEVASIPGIGKDDSGYSKVQAQVLKLRREGRLAYEHIADLTRWMRKPSTFNSVQDALEDTARLYRKALWNDAKEYIEVWCEKDALAGVILPITSAYDVPLMVSRGFASETFCYEAIASRDTDKRDYYVYYFGDFDRAGQDAAKSLEKKLRGFAAEAGIQIYFVQLAVRPEQVSFWNLPTREPKRKTAADRKWSYDYACELDAIPPDILRQIVLAAIERHLPEDQYRILKAAEASERELLEQLVFKANRQQSDHVYDIE